MIRQSRLSDTNLPRAVGEFRHRHMPNSTLHIIANVGHCPHMSAPTASSRAIDNFLAHALR